MADIRKPDLNPFTYLDLFVIVAGNQPPDRPVRIFHRVQWLNHRAGASLCLAVLPFCLLHLNMRTVTKHDTAQITGGHCGIDAALESSGT